MSGTEKIEFVLVTLVAVSFCFLTNCGIKMRKQKKAYERRIKILEKEIRYDDLSGVLSRKAFIDDVSAEIAASGEGTLLIFDINGFKAVNDTYGHFAGDELIKRFASKLEKAFGKENTGRLGGDEFVVFVKGDCGKDKMISSINKSGVSSFYDKQTKLELSSCCGAVLCRSSRDRFEDLYKKADKALYRAKKDSSAIAYYTGEEIDENE